MYDIFISYSKADHASALKLSAFLEAEGWTVWWDRSLGAADLYRDEIMKQLAAARAVITIWSQNSVKSDWVRAEAGRAKADGKLIPVKTSEVAYADIPLPFGEMHTENIGSTDLIRAAIVAQLAKPSLPHSPFSQISGIVKYQVLMWIGIVGTSLTLFSNLKGILDLADWARELVDHWHSWTQMFWGGLFSLLKIKLPRELVPIISFTTFTVVLVVGVNLYGRTVRSAVKLQHSPSVARKVRILGGGVLLVLVEPVIIILPVFIILQGILAFVSHSVKVAIVVVMLIVLVGIPAGYLVYFSKERSLAGVNSLLFIIMTFWLLYLPLQTLESDYYLVLGVLLLFPICWMAVILFSPLQQLTKRLGFVVLGVAILIGLSEISKLNLHQYLQPPKVSDNSAR
jgi:hypothetical protein